MKALGQTWKHTRCISSVPPDAHIYVVDALQILNKKTRQIRTKDTTPASLPTQVESAGHRQLP